MCVCVCVGAWRGSARPVFGDKKILRIRVDQLVTHERRCQISSCIIRGADFSSFPRRSGWLGEKSLACGPDVNLFEQLRLEWRKCLFGRARSGGNV